MSRIAFFLPSLVGGGAERVCVNLAEGFLGRGHSVDVVLARAHGPLLAALPPGARLFDLRARRVLSALPGLVDYLRAEQPDALIAAPDHVNPVALVGKLLSRGRTRLAVTHHIHPSLSIRHSPKLQEKLYPHLFRLFQDQAAAVIAVSRGVADDLAGLTGVERGRITVIYNPVIGPGTAALKAEALEHPWFASGEPPVLLGVGRLTAQKDFSTLMRAFALVRGRRKARLLILGEGEQRQRLQGLAGDLGLAEDVRLPGYVSNPYPYLARCAAFVLASAWEGFGIVIVEALACGTQVVSTDCPSGPAEILEGGRYGRLVPVGDAESMAQAIEAALEAPLPEGELQKRAEAFSIDASAEAYLRALGLE